MCARGTRQSLVLGLLALCVSPLVTPAQVSAQSEGMPWRTDFQAARAEAQQSGKLLLVHFWTETCGPCKLLHTEMPVIIILHMELAVTGSLWLQIFPTLSGLSNAYFVIPAIS